MPNPHTPDEFREWLYSRKYTLHQLRMRLQQLSPDQRAEALLGIFTTRRSPDTAFGDQEIAGRLLIALRPECRRSLDDILRSIASTWNVSVEELPHYLCAVFGRGEVIAAAARLERDYPAESPEARALGTVRWWLSGKN